VLSLDSLLAVKKVEAGEAVMAGGDGLMQTGHHPHARQLRRGGGGGGGHRQGVFTNLSGWLTS